MLKISLHLNREVSKPEERMRSQSGGTAANTSVSPSRNSHSERTRVAIVF